MLAMVTGAASGAGVLAGAGSAVAASSSTAVAAGGMGVLLAETAVGVSTGAFNSETSLQADRRDIMAKEYKMFLIIIS